MTRKHLTFGLKLFHTRILPLWHTMSDLTSLVGDALNLDKNATHITVQLSTIFSISLFRDALLKQIYSVETISFVAEDLDSCNNNRKKINPKMEIVTQVSTLGEILELLWLRSFLLQGRTTTLFGICLPGVSCFLQNRSYFMMVEKMQFFLFYIF